MYLLNLPCKNKKYSVVLQAYIQGEEIQSQDLLPLGLIPVTWSAEIDTPHPTAYTLGCSPERRRKDPPHTHR